MVIAAALYKAIPPFSTIEEMSNRFRAAGHFFRLALAISPPLLRHLPKIAAVSGRCLPYALFEMSDAHAFSVVRLYV